MFKNILLVGLGGGLGSMLRYACSLAIGSRSFPYATFAVNILGSFLIGLFIAMSARDDIFSNNWRLFLTAGICGGFTTFSAFSEENLRLLQEGKYALVLTYIVLSIVAGIAAAWLGFRILDT